MKSPIYNFFFNLFFISVDMLLLLCAAEIARSNRPASALADLPLLDAEAAAADDELESTDMKFTGFSGSVNRIETTGRWCGTLALLLS